MNPTQDDMLKKIPGYLDGVLSDEERLQFEAHVGTDPAFAQVFRRRQAEHEALCERIPDFEGSEETHKQLSRELQETIKNLFYEEDAAPHSRFSSWLREWL